MLAFLWTHFMLSIFHSLACPAIVWILCTLFRLCLLNHHIRFASLACSHSFTTLKPFILHTIYILIDILCIFVGFRHKTNINLNPLWIELQVNTLWWKVLSDKCHVTFYIENRQRQRQTKTTDCYNANLTQKKSVLRSRFIHWLSDKNCEKQEQKIMLSKTHRTLQYINETTSLFTLRFGLRLSLFILFAMFVLYLYIFSYETEERLTRNPKPVQIHVYVYTKLCPVMLFAWLLIDNSITMFHLICTKITIESDHF